MQAYTVHIADGQKGEKTADNDYRSSFAAQNQIWTTFFKGEKKYDQTSKTHKYRCEKNNQHTNNAQTFEILMDGKENTRILPITARNNRNSYKQAQIMRSWRR